MNQRARVLDILTDGKPHTLPEIQARIEERFGTRYKLTSIRQQVRNINTERHYRIADGEIGNDRYFRLEPNQ